MFNLRGKNALIVGGGGDLGFAISEGLAEAGASIALMDIAPCVHDYASDLRASGHRASSVLCDISVRSNLDAAITETNQLLDGTIDILVNAAGIQRRFPSEAFPINEWDAVLEVNLNASFLLAQRVVPAMFEKKYGKIINVSSIMSSFGGINIPAYAAAKGGLTQLTRALSNDWATRGIRVNAIAPGYFDTQMNTALLEDTKRMTEILMRTPVGRMGTPSDIKGTAVFLAAPASDYITGAVIPVDGGYSSR